MADPITEERYEAMIAAYMEQPGVHMAAKRAAQCDWRTARKCWEHGSGGRKPIKEIVADRQRVRRALVADAEESLEAERARIRAEFSTAAQQNVADVRAERERAEATIRDMEAAAARLEEATRRQQTALEARGNSDADASAVRQLAWVRNVQSFNLAVLSVLQGALRPDAVKALHDKLHHAVVGGNLSDKEAVSLARSLAGLAKPLTESLKIGVEAENLVAGRPTSITDSHTTVTVEGIDDAVQEFRRLLAQQEARTATTPPLEEAEVVPALPPKIDEEPAAPVQCPSELPERNDGNACIQTDGVAAQQTGEDVGAGGTCTTSSTHVLPMGGEHYPFTNSQPPIAPLHTDPVASSSEPVVEPPVEVEEPGMTDEEIAAMGKAAAEERMAARLRPVMCGYCGREFGGAAELDEHVCKQEG